MRTYTRREFLKLSGTAALGLALSKLDLQLLDPINVDNPLAGYPNRDWEKVYRNQYAYDSTFTYVCSPNDTHACRLRAFVRNGVILRSETNYDVANYGDLYGNKATAHWHPRAPEGADVPPPHVRAAPPRGRSCVAGKWPTPVSRSRRGRQPLKIGRSEGWMNFPSWRGLRLSRAA